MASKGNIAYQMNGMEDGKAVSSTRIDTIYRTTDGLVMGVTNISTIAALSALRVAVGETFSPGCIIIPISSVCDALASARAWQNIGTAAVPVITQLVDAV